MHRPFEEPHCIDKTSLVFRKARRDKMNNFLPTRWRVLKSTHCVVVLMEPIRRIAKPLLCNAISSYRCFFPSSTACRPQLVPLPLRPIAEQDQALIPMTLQECRQVTRVVFWECVQFQQHARGRSVPALSEA